MSMKYLGERFDIHTGGTDLRFPAPRGRDRAVRGRRRPPGRVDLGPRAATCVRRARRSRSRPATWSSCADLVERGVRPAQLPVAVLPDPVPVRDGLHVGGDGDGRSAREAAPTPDGRLGAGGRASSAPPPPAFDARFREALADDLAMPGRGRHRQRARLVHRGPRRREVRACWRPGTTCSVSISSARPRAGWEPIGGDARPRGRARRGAGREGLRHLGPDPRRAGRDGTRGHGHGRGHEDPASRLMSIDDAKLARRPVECSTPSSVTATMSSIRTPSRPSR